MYKLYIIGLGNRGLTHIQIISARPNIQIVGAYDASSKIRSECKKNFKFSIYDNLAASLEKTQPDIIIIATPPKIRYELFTHFTALNSLRMIILEKPLALTMKEASLINALCKDKGWHLQIVHQSRFADEFIQLKQSIDAGKLGEILFFKAACYGNIFDQGSHTVDLIRWLTQDQRILWVDATGHDDQQLLKPFSKFPNINVQELGHDHPGNLWSSINIRLENGIEVLITCGVLDANPLPELGPWMQRRIIAVGTAGVAETHLAAHYKEFALAESGANASLTSPEKYMESLHRFYDHVLNSLHCDESERIKNIDNHLFTLATLVAAFMSAKNHQFVPIPLELSDLANFDNYFKPSKMNLLSQPIEEHFEEINSNSKISIIIPMETHRDMGRAAVLSWLNQTCDSNIYQIILVFHEHQKELLQDLEPYLRIQDKAISCIATNELELCHIGALAAEGDYLLFTESHCQAEPEVIKQIINFFKIENYTSFYPRTLSLSKNSVGKMEARSYQLGVDAFSKENQWARLTLHAFVLKKELYFDLGGFEYKYNRFAYWLFAAKLYLNGHKLGYAPGVAIQHLFAENFSQLHQFLLEYIGGECKFYLEAEINDPYFSLANKPAEWLHARQDRIKLTKNILHNILTTKNFFSKKKIAAVFVLKDSLFLLLRNRFKKNYFRFYYFFTRFFSRTGYYLTGMRTEWAWQCFNYYSRKTIAWYQTKIALLNSKKEKNEPENYSLNYSLATLPDEYFYGIHRSEKYNSVAFRWTSRIGAIKINMAPNDYVVHIQLLKNICSIDRLERTQFFLNKKAINDVQYINSNEIKLLVHKEMFSEQEQLWLLIISKIEPKFSKNADTRTLGLPIQTITFQVTSK